MISQDLVDHSVLPSSEHTFRFDGFEANRERYQLRSGSGTVKLERIPLELLFLLLEHRGKLVDREQIVARLWRDDSFLDTERSINTAVRKLRKALGDDPHRPRFIETVVGKGYRFVSPLITENDSLKPGIRSIRPAASHVGNGNSHEIRLRGFFVETKDKKPVLSCDVVVSGIVLGRVPLVELNLPEGVTLPLRLEDRLLLKLYGMRVTLTPEATQALYAFAISVLQSGLRTRATDYLAASKDSNHVASEAND